MAAEFLRRKGGGVMDLIAHFWDRLPQTPPLARSDLHLVIVWSPPTTTDGQLPPMREQDIYNASGAMLFVPRAGRADVLATDDITADMLMRYILEWKPSIRAGGNLSDIPLNGKSERPGPQTGELCAVNFITGEAKGIQAMLPGLLEKTNRKIPAKMAINIVMQLAEEMPATASVRVRLARDGDEAVLNRWRKLYKEERGILFDADVDAWIDSRKVYVCENAGQIVSIGKFDLELFNLIEIGGIYTFPEYRRHGFGRELVSDLAHRIRLAKKIPALQVDEENRSALKVYETAGWKCIGKLARVWISSF